MNKDYFIDLNGLSPRERSIEIDKDLGFNIKNIEETLCREVESSIETGSKTSIPHLESRSWIGLHSQIFQTAYSELAEIVLKLESQNVQSFIDLGAAYGRLGIVLDVFYDQYSFKGYEFIKERVNEGLRVYQDLGIKKSELICMNILKKDFEIPKADVYFIYDFSNPADLKIILDQFSNKLDQDRFILVAKGQAIRSLIQNKYKEFYVLNTPFHEENWSLYSSYSDLI